MHTRSLAILILLALLLGLVAVAHLFTGDARGGLHWPEDWAFAAIRLRRLAIAATVGGSLALAGVLLQALLRNPLASPDLLGVTSGAGLGVAVASFVAMQAGASAGPAAQSLAALAGAAGTLAIILAWTHRRGGIDVVSMVLVGVIVGMTSAGLTLLLHHLMPDRGVAARAWFFGSINESTSPAMLATAAGLLAAGLGASLFLGREIDAACLGEDEARSVGVRLARLRFVLFGVSGLLATAAVLLAGPIGFVGLIVPHAVRLVLGPRHRPLLVGATLAGAAVVIAADATVSAFRFQEGGRVPVGVVMAIVGGPCFLLLLRSTLRRAVLT